MRGLTGCLLLPFIAAGCATSLQDVPARQQALQLRPGGEATLRVDCPEGQAAISASHASGGRLIVAESRAVDVGTWWVTFANPTADTVEEDIAISLTCR